MCIGFRVQEAWKLAASLQAELTSHESHINKLQVLLPYRYLLLNPATLKSLLSCNLTKLAELLNIVSFYQLC